MKRIVPVARAWSELANLIEAAAVDTVEELGPETVVTYAEKLWVLAPEEGLI